MSKNIEIYAKKEFVFANFTEGSKNSRDDSIEVN